MIKQLLTYGNTFCAVEHSFTENATEEIHFLQLKKTKKELLIEAKEHFSSIEEALVNHKAQKHLFLIINNQQVLFKKIKETHPNHELIVKKAFPNIKLSEFFYEVSQQQESSFVAICRKEYVDKLIQEYSVNGVSIINFSLHNLAFEFITPYLNQSEIKTSNALITFADNTVENIEKKLVTEEEYTINNLQISNKYVLPLAGIISYFSNTANSQNNYTDLQQVLQKNYTSKRFYILGFKIALGTIFFVLLTNFVFFSQARKQLVTLTTQIEANTSYKNTLLQLKDRVDKKNELANSLTSLSTSKTSWYLNELGKSVPNTLQLNEIKFQPLVKSIKKNKEILVDKNKIIIKGSSKNNQDFSNWIAKLELENWIDTVVVISHGTGKQTTSTFEFVITIKQ